MGLASESGLGKMRHPGLPKRAPCDAGTGMQGRHQISQLHQMFSRVATVSTKVVLPRSRTRFVARMSTIKVSISVHILTSWHCVMLAFSEVDVVFDKIDLHVC